MLACVVGKIRRENQPVRAGFPIPFGSELFSRRIGTAVVAVANGAAVMRLERTAGKEMLVLSRRVGERILIGENISVTVVRIAGGAVRLGIEAPGDLSIMRDELREDSGRGNKEPAASARETSTTS